MAYEPESVPSSDMKWDGTLISDFQTPRAMSNNKTCHISHSVSCSILQSNALPLGHTAIIWYSVPAAHTD